MFIIRKCLIFKEKVKMIFPSKKNLIQMKTNRMNSISQEDVSTMGEQFPSALSAAAAAKSPQSCPTLCNPIDSSPPGSPVPGILQERTLERVAISFSNAWKWKVKVKSLSHVQLFATPWTAAYQAPPPMGFSRQECWSGVPLPSLSTVYSGKIQCRIFQWVPVVTKSWSLPSRSLMEGGSVNNVNLITQISHSSGIIEAGMLVQRKH